MEAQLVDKMGSDLTVANAARVSFNKHKETFDASDAKLIKYLASHNHWTPFAHPQLTLRVKAPVCIRTQCFKHKQGFVENEVSRRYVDDPPEFFWPDTWRGRPVHSKQGSSDVAIEEITFYGTVETWKGHPNSLYGAHLDACEAFYYSLIKAGVAPEQARMVLPQSMYTEWYWTGSLAAYARFYKLRNDPHAQKEIQDLAVMIGEIIQPLFPVSWEALSA